MPRRRRRIDGIWPGLLVSLALHLAGVGALVASTSADPADLLSPSPPADPADDTAAPPARLGIAESERVTINWIGFADPTPHRALPSEIEQAAMSLAPVGRPTDDPSPVEADTPRPTAAQPQPPDPVEPTEPVEPADPRPRAAPPSAPQPPGLALPDRLADDPLTEPADAATIGLPPAPPSPQPTPEPTPRTAPPAESPAETPAETPADQPPQPPAEQPATTPGGGPAGADDLPGNPSDLESTPTAREPAVTIDDWGRPAAAEGIEVIPRRPRWGPTISSLARPRSPTVIIEFDRTGTVRRATFAEVDGVRQTTGSTEVDRVLLNSVYNWRARGDRIESLPPEGPGSLYTIRVFIRLRF